MNSTDITHNPRWWLAWLPRSIVARTTLSILALSLLLGFVFASIASIRAQRTEELRLRTQLQELLSTVESTVRIACYLGDDTLAREIVQGLLSNQAIAAVRITANGKPLVTSSDLNHLKQASTALTRRIDSPFSPGTQVGEITLYARDAYITAQAQRYSRSTAWALGLQVTLVAAAVALVVFVFVTRPIRSISNELHKLELATGMHLSVPASNRTDEIGRLVTDVNGLISNLTELVHSERDLRMEHQQQQRRIQLIFDKAETALFVFDINGHLQSWNPAFAHMLPIPTHELGDLSRARLHNLLAPHGMALDALIQRVLETGEGSAIDIELSLPDKTHSDWFELSINPISHDVLQGVMNDITARKHAELSAQRAAIQDPLTGLLNRAGMQQRLEQLFTASINNQWSQVALLQIDLDHFKQVNDTLGHEAGDQVLIQVARILEACTRRSDVLCRPGGDEFMVALIGIDGADRARSIADAMIARIRERMDVGQGRFAEIGASIGIAFPHRADETPESVLRRSDAAMYRAKQSGRAQTFFAEIVASDASTDGGKLANL